MCADLQQGMQMASTCREAQGIEIVGLELMIPPSTTTQHNMTLVCNIAGIKASATLQNCPAGLHSSPIMHPLDVHVSMLSGATCDVLERVLMAAVQSSRLQCWLKTLHCRSEEVNCNIACLANEHQGLMLRSKWDSSLHRLLNVACTMQPTSAL